MTALRAAAGLFFTVLLAGLLAADPPAAKRPLYLKTQEGRPVFLAGPGDPEGFLYRGERRPDGTRAGDQLDLIAKLKPTGANTIYIVAIRSHGGDGGPTENPFLDSDPRRGVDRRILDQWEGWLRALDEAGIAQFFFLYDDGASPFGPGDSLGAPEEEFLQALAGRFRHHRRLIWCIAEEYEEALSPKRVSAIARMIKKHDPRHPVAVHKLHGLGFQELADDPSIDLFAVQWNVESAAEIHAGMAKAFGEARGRYGIIFSECASHGRGESARKKSWAAALAGAQVMVLGMDIASTAVRDLEDHGRLARFLESAEFAAMSPRDDLKHEGTGHVLADPPRSYLAYASSLAGGMGLKGLQPGSYTLRWLDCASGEEAEERDVRLPAGDASRMPPARWGNRSGREIALHVKREKD